MHVIGEKVVGKFIRRVNRFVVEVELGNGKVLAHLRDPGRLKELLVSSAEIMLRKKERPIKLGYEVLAVKKGKDWMLVNSALHPRLTEELIDMKIIRGLERCRVKRRELKYGSSRIDFLLDCNGKNMFLEVKGCTLIIDGIALFPDAPTKRGRRHVKELMKAAREGYKAAVLFLVMKGDAKYLIPNMETDPEFASELKRARENGVELHAYTFTFDGEEIKPVKEIEVRVDGVEDLIPKLYQEK